MGDLSSRENPVRVLQLVSFAQGAGERKGAGGPEIRTLESLSYWSEKEVEVIVAYASAGKLARHFKTYKRWIDFAVTDRKRLRTIISLVHLIRLREIDVIHTQGPVYTDFIATLAARLTGKRNIVTRAVQIADLQCGWFKKVLFHLIDYYTKYQCDQMVAISSMGKKTLEAEGCPSKKITVIYNGCNLEKYYPDVPPLINRSSQREFFIGMFAQMVSHKRHDLLLEAMKLAIQENREWHLFLVGDGPLYYRWTDMVKTLGLEKNVTFLGFQRELPGLYTAMNVVVLTSDREGLPVSLIEGMACGRPCIASAVGATGELLEHGKTGWLLEKNDSFQLYKYIVLLDENRVYAEEMGRSARLVVETRHGIEDMVRGYERLYKKP